MAASFWQDAVELGATPAGLGARDTLRLEIGMPLYGHELSADHNAAEAGFERAVSRQKDFIGSERIPLPEQAKSRLTGIELEGRRAARAGDHVLDSDGNEIGVVTSGSFAPSLGKAVALAYLDQGAAATGSKVGIAQARKALTGQVVELPFYKEGTARKKLQGFVP